VPRPPPAGGFFRKGISGGERKRASIGVELLIDPSVLMLVRPQHATTLVPRATPWSPVTPPTVS
jgi:hypothetical protein